MLPARNGARWERGQTCGPNSLWLGSGEKQGAFAPRSRHSAWAMMLLPFGQPETCRVPSSLATTFRLCWQSNLELRNSRKEIVAIPEFQIGPPLPYSRDAVAIPRKTRQRAAPCNRNATSMPNCVCRTSPSSPWRIGMAAVSHPTTETVIRRASGSSRVSRRT